MVDELTEAKPILTSKENDPTHLQDIVQTSEQTTSLDETPENVKELIEETVLQSEQQMFLPSYKDQKETIQPLLAQWLKKGDSWYNVFDLY